MAHNRLQFFVAFLLTLSESTFGESETADVFVADSAPLSSGIETDSILQSFSSDIDTALNEIVASKFVSESGQGTNVIKSDKPEPNLGLASSELLGLIKDSLNRSGLLRDDILAFFEQNKTSNVLPLVGLQCAILLYNETVDFPFRIKSAVEMNRAYETLSLEGEQLIQLLTEFVKTVEQTNAIIDEVDGPMTQSVKEHIISPFTYENFRVTYGAVVLRIQAFQHKAVQASREGKVRKDLLGAEAIKYEGLRNCHNYTQSFLESEGIYLHSPSHNSSQVPEAFHVIEQLDQVMNLFVQLAAINKTAGDKADGKGEVTLIKSKIESMIREFNDTFRFYGQLLAKARIEIDSRAKQIIEVNSNITGLRLLNVLSHILIQNEKARVSLDRYDLFVRSVRNKKQDSDEDYDHDEL